MKDAEKREQRNTWDTCDVRATYLQALLYHSGIKTCGAYFLCLNKAVEKLLLI